MVHRNTRNKKRLHKRRSTLRYRRHRGGSDCPPGWTHTGAQEAAVIELYSGYHKLFEGKVEFTDRKGNLQTCKIVISKRFGGFCTDNFSALTDLANNYAGFLRAKPGNVKWTYDISVRPAGF